MTSVHLFLQLLPLLLLLFLLASKSMFMWYMIMEVAAERKYNVLVELSPFWIAFYKDGVSDRGNELFKGPVIHLIDEQCSGSHYGFVTVFGSPNYNTTKWIHKTGGGAPLTQLVLPPWSQGKQEFIDMCCYGGCSQVGGICSHIAMILDEVIVKVGLRGIPASVGQTILVPFDMTLKDELYVEYTFGFSSDHIKYFDHCWTVKKDELLEFVTASEGPTNMSALRLYACIRSISLGQCWSRKRLAKTQFRIDTRIVSASFWKIDASGLTPT
ncbi:hypothetical protein SELMODRAFT_422080 [Selaginella moellendorffii]|uniref:Uncharacterized protein n=1 Tax=Selaginella moellendorffii TaxID=88036 RepID=D8SH98_SELML|nr:hypothetical protein SELMODRAFT_422080 [Selaginella moellendorffii]